VTSPFQAAMRADFRAGDLAIVVGVTGGLGVYAAQICAALGAKEVVGIARNPQKLERARKYGVTHTISSANKSARDIRDEFRSYCKAKGLPGNYGWKIFEWSGTAAGQEIALELLSYIEVLMICGYGLQKNEYQLSRLMAFDADIKGTWGCLPKYYPEVLKMVLAKKIQIEPFVETRPMSQIARVFEDVHKGAQDRRIVLVPDF
jgi:6-hydroxycyclohex-1-ene-1-carbonyl-CoA dehydrogenase